MAQRSIADYQKLLGWKPDIPDMRDYEYVIPKELVGAALPTKIDLRLACPPIGNQGSLGSCTAFAIGAAVRFNQIQIGQDFDPSELFLYYNERLMEGTVSYDSGAMIRDGMKSINQTGICTETFWTYNVKQYKVKPPTTAYNNAKTHKSIQYERLSQTLTTLQTVLSTGKPFVFGFTVYQSFMNNTVAQTGTVPMPVKNEKVMGGHAVLCVGYDNSIQRFICRNSWGTGWGAAGYFTMPYAYLTNTNLSTDFWVLKTMTVKK